MYLTRYITSRLFVFWFSIGILVYGWFNNAKLVNAAFGASETLIKNLAKLDETGRTETVALHVLHVADLVVIGAIMVGVTMVLTIVRNLVLGSGERRMTVARAIAHVVTLLVLSYIVLAAIWWHDARLVNAWFDASRALIGEFAAAIDPQGQLELVFRTLGLARHVVVGCLMLALALAWEILKSTLRGVQWLIARD